MQASKSEWYLTIEDLKFKEKILENKPLGMNETIAYQRARDLLSVYQDTKRYRGFLMRTEIILVI